MMDVEIIKIEKSLDERLDDISNVFVNAVVSVPADVRTIWSDYLDLSFNVTARSGWKALWKVSRYARESLGESFPTCLIVKVLDINFSELNADVLVDDENNETGFGMHTASLIGLFPLVQEHDNVYNISECLDTFRFFYRHLWMPWEDDKLAKDWIASCLEHRFSLFQDMETQKISLPAVKHIRQCILKGKSLYKDLLVLKSEKDKFEENKMETDDVETWNLLLLEIMKVEEEFNRVLYEIEQWQNPMFRKFLNESLMNSEPIVRVKHYFIVWKGGRYEDIKLMDELKCSISGNDYVELTPFKKALEEACDGDTICLFPDIHLLNFEIPFMKKGTIEGFADPSGVIVTTGKSHSFVWKGENLLLKHLTIYGQVLQKHLLVVASGAVVIENCKLYGDNKQVQGLYVLSGCKAELRGCEISTFHCGITVGPGALLCLTGCAIRNCSKGLAISGEAEIIVKNSCIEENSYGLTIYHGQQEEKGSSDLLNGCEKLMLESVKMGENDCDVYIRPSGMNPEDEMESTSENI